MTTLDNPYLTALDKNWIAQAELLKTKSLDPNRKVGCLFVKENVKLAEGYNHLPLINLPSSRLLDQSLKNMSIIHAEVAAVADAANRGVSTKGCSAFITCHPCSSCANVLISAGVRKIVCPNFRGYFGSWAESFRVASDDLYNSGITVLYYSDLSQ